ncbi:MAG: hypothetical protein LUQ57_01385, partial [Methylococcaceae bacterium]|nr:hypothetical protein [Methylococcaceae bacterium]
MINRRKVFLLTTAAALNLSACSYIQSLFPDKEKDYQYTTEIPPLVLPNDLNAGAVAKSAEAPSLLNTEPVKDQNQPPTEPEQAEKVSEDTEATETAGTEEKSKQTEQPTTESGETVQQEKSEQKTPEAKKEKKDAEQEGTPVELVRFSDGERRLRIASSPDKSWHLVSKALSRNSVEVTKRDQNQKSFYVRYDP